MIPGFVQRCFLSSEHEPQRWSRKRFYSFNLLAHTLDRFFGWCAGIAKSSCCGVKKKVAVAAGIYETLWCRFQKSDVSKDQDGD